MRIPERPPNIEAFRSRIKQRDALIGHVIAPRISRHPSTLNQAKHSQRGEMVAQTMREGYTLMQEANNNPESTTELISPKMPGDSRNTPCST